MSIANKNISNKNSFYKDLNINIIVALVILVFCLTLGVFWPKTSSLSSELNWEISMANIGWSPPQLHDINNDGTHDIIIGSGHDHLNSSSNGISAIDGKTGHLIWHRSTPAGVTSRPMLMDINGDEILDVSVTGQFSDVWMLDGASGEIIWELSKVNHDLSALPCDFSTPIPVGDIDNDGLTDLLVMQQKLSHNSTHLKLINKQTNTAIANKNNRHDIIAALKKTFENSTDNMIAFDVCKGQSCQKKEIEREFFYKHPMDRTILELVSNQKGPGSQGHIISSRTGAIITSFSPQPITSLGVPIYLKLGERHHIIYASGGYRQPGFIRSQNIITGDIDWTVEVPLKGVVSSPLLMIKDNSPVVVVNSMSGDVFSIDAISGNVRWHRTVGDGYEATTSVSKIQRHLNYTDIVSVFSWGTWPNYDFSTLFIFDGQTGDIVFRKKIGDCHTGAPPIVTDIDEDQLDEIIVMTCSDKRSDLIMMKNDMMIPLGDFESGTYSAPVIQDMNNDTVIDIIISRFHSLSRHQIIKGN